MFIYIIKVNLFRNIEKLSYFRILRCEGLGGKLQVKISVLVILNLFALLYCWCGKKVRKEMLRYFQFLPMRLKKFGKGSPRHSGNFSSFRTIVLKLVRTLFICGTPKSTSKHFYNLLKQTNTRSKSVNINTKIMYWIG